MSVVLSILQVLGWILFIALLILLLAVLILLFCPVHYLVEGEWLEEKWAKFKAHWLWHLLRVKISYGDDLIYGEIHIFWKKMTFSFDFTKKVDEIVDEAADEVEEVISESSDEAVEGIDEISKDAVDSEDSEENASEEKVIGTETAAELRGEMKSDSEIKENQNIESEENVNTETKSYADENSEEKLLEEEILTEDTDESIVSKIKGILERIKEIYAKIRFILADEQNHDAVNHLKDEVIYFIKILLPKKSKVNAVFSTGSPDTTGQLFGILACFPAMYHADWKLIPDFEAEDPYVKGTIWGKGRFAIYQFVGIILRIVFDKNCRRLYTMINKFIKWLKKDDKSQEEK